MARRTRIAKRRVTSEALLIQRLPFGEADLIVRLFTQEAGTVAALARGARRSAKRFPALEPMHVLKVSFDVAPQRNMSTLVEARVLRPRLQLATRLAPMEAAGRALRWLRRVVPESTSEPLLWARINRLLDELDAMQGRGKDAADALLAVAGMEILATAGWEMDLEACVYCRRPCPATKRVTVDVAAGGIVCARCGGGAILLSGQERLELLAASRGVEVDLEPECAAQALRLVDKALAVHGHGEAS